MSEKLLNGEVPVSKVPETAFIVKDIKVNKLQVFCKTVPWMLLICGIAFLIAYNVHLSMKIFRLESKVNDLENVFILEEETVARNGSYVSMDDENHARDDGVNLGDFLRQQTENKVRVKRGGVRRGRSKCCERLGCHLVAARRRDVLPNGHYFTWTRQSHLSSCQMTTIDDSNSNGIKNIRITKDGFYLVYAQATFAGTGRNTIGFETVKIDQYPSPSEEVLMTTVKKQEKRAMRPLDSAQQSGVFRLYPGQQLEVRPVMTTTATFDLRPDYSYFGVIFLYP